MKKLTAEELQNLAQKFRIDIIKTLHEKGSGHWGGSSSVADILTTLYFDRINVDPENPDWEERDRIVLSKGHAAPILYRVLQEKGFFREGQNISQLRDINSPLQGHPCMQKTPGVDMSTGALGHGLSVGLGMSLMAEKAANPWWTYVIVGEGCLQEGTSWEAIMAAGKFAPSRLCLIVDYNKVQLDGTCDEIMPMDPLADKFRAFNWNVAETSYNGHDINEIRNSFAWLDEQKTGPSVIIYDTVKGKGVSFMENTNVWHGAPVRDEHLEKALPELEATLKEKGE